MLPVQVTPDWALPDGQVRTGLYTVPFDAAIDHFKDQLGLNHAWRVANQRSTVALEARMTFLAPAFLGDALTVQTRILDCDAKRLHLGQQLKRGETVLVTRESLAISFDLEARRSCAFPDDVATNIRALHAAQQQLPAWAWVGQQAVSLAR